MHHCSTKWAVFLMSLKSLVETGKGDPYPNDIKIDNWTNFLKKVTGTPRLTMLHATSS